MTKLIAAIAMILSLAPHPAGATSICIAPPIEEALASSSGVVAATPIAISFKKSGTTQTQTILWAVNESWKGAHYKKSTFTTRNTWIAPVKKGQPWLLYLAGKEPYQVRHAPCGRSQALQEALQDVRILYRSIEASRNGA